MEDEMLNMSVHHGTVSSCADGIYKIGFQHSKKKNEWLGHGVYFFERYDDAKWWSILEAKKTENINDFPEVIIVDILCYKESFFDLDCEDNMNKLLDEMEGVFASLGKNGCGAPSFENVDQVRCFCCNLYRRQHSNIKVIAYSFPIGRSAYNFVGFPTSIKRRQYCVSDNDAIVLKKREVIDYAI